MQKPASRFTHNQVLGVVLGFVSTLRGRPPFLPMALSCSFVSLAARAFPPMRANSEIVSGFFMPQSYHEPHGSRSAFSLKEAFTMGWTNRTPP
jgi:hypothetical protein